MSNTKQGSPLVRLKAFEKRSAIARDAAGDIKSQTVTVGAPADPAAPDIEVFDVLWVSGTQTQLSIHKAFDFYGNVALAQGGTLGGGWLNLGVSARINVGQIAMIVRVDD